MRRVRIHRRSKGQEEGVIIILVAVFMLFVMGAMAAISIDITTFYTARSEAQLAADGAALAAARTLANSGMTSDPNAVADGLKDAAKLQATTVAQQVAETNQIGGGPITASQVNVSFSDTTSPSSFVNNPRVTVQVTAALPTFFARIWGSTQVTVGASATAEAYNPSGLSTGVLGASAGPVITTCVKPWLLPNMDPSPAPPDGRIFDQTTGAILNPALLGEEVNPPNRLKTACLTGPEAPTQCNSSYAPQVWRYYPGDPGNFPAPSSGSVVCPSCATKFQLAIAGCVQTPISCNSSVNIDVNTTEDWNVDAATAVDALTNSSSNGGDNVATLNPSLPPFQFVAGDDNPIVTSGTKVMVSDSLVTVPVFDSSCATWPCAGFPSVQVIGFVQLFLNPNGNKVPGNNHILSTVINMVGCGTGATGTPVYGNGPSAVPVRLITPP